MKRLLTEVVLWITRAFANRPIGTFWAMSEVIVLVSDILKEVNLVFALEEPSGNAMYHGVSPALERMVSATRGSRQPG